MYAHNVFSNNRYLCSQIGVCFNEEDLKDKKGIICRYSGPNTIAMMVIWIKVFPAYGKDRLTLPMKHLEVKSLLIEIDYSTIAETDVDIDLLHGKNWEIESTIR